MSETYTSIKLPTAFVEECVDPLVNSKGMGFSSRAEVVKAALRDFTNKRKNEVPA